MRIAVTMCLGLAIAGGMALPAGADETATATDVRVAPPPMSGLMFFVPYEGPSRPRAASRAVMEHPASAPASGPAAEPAPRQPSGAVADAETPKPSPAAQASAAEGYYLVVRSYNDRAEAARAARRLAPVKARIATAEVRGRTWYRVYVGPLPPRDAERHRARLARAGFDGAWGISACPAGRAAPDCLMPR